MQLDLFAHLFTHVGEDPLRKLDPSHFESDISYYTEKHHPGTREWLFSEVNKWHQHTATDRNSQHVPVDWKSWYGQISSCSETVYNGRRERNPGWVLLLPAQQDPQKYSQNAGADTCLPVEFYIP